MQNQAVYHDSDFLQYHQAIKIHMDSFYFILMVEIVPLKK
jgi:hypothetical protein